MIFFKVMRRGCLQFSANLPCISDPHEANPATAHNNRSSVSQSQATRVSCAHHSLIIVAWLVNTRLLPLLVNCSTSTGHEPARLQPLCSFQWDLVYSHWRLPIHLTISPSPRHRHSKGWPFTSGWPVWPPSFRAQTFTTTYALQSDPASFSRYFAIVFSANRSFPHYMGVASGTSMALFGFSPLLLCALASRFFTHPETGLDVAHFIAFLALLSGLVNLFGAICMQGPEKQHLSPAILSENSSCSEATLLSHDPEQEPLLNSPTKQVSEVGVCIVTVPEPQHGTVGDLLRDPCFWLLSIVCLIVIGAVCWPLIMNSNATKLI